jgi:hypothetical protein
MADLSEISVAIPSYNARHYLARCLRTLEKEAPETEVIVVDGASPDGSAQMVEAEFPGVVLSRVDNRGWAHATNRGLELATRRYLLLLNSDAFVDRAAMIAMQDRLESQSDLAGVAPMLRNEDGTRQAVFGPWYWPRWTNIVRPTTVPVVSAACLMLTRRSLEMVGAFDENFFFYNEEYDWCRRAKDAGLRLEMLPVSVVHVGGGSTPTDPRFTREAQRAFVYLSSKHWPDWVTDCLRGGILMESWLGKHVDPRPNHRGMWAELETSMRKRAYLDSPFHLSGRGVPDVTGSGSAH